MSCFQDCYVKVSSALSLFYFAAGACDRRRRRRLCNDQTTGGRSKCKEDRILVNGKREATIFHCLHQIRAAMSWPLATRTSSFSFATLLMTARMIPVALTLNFTTEASNIDGNDDIAKEINDEEEEYTPYSDRPETYIVPIVFLLILLIGLTGNGVLALTILRHANMRNVPNTYVLSLALGDLLARNI